MSELPKGWYLTRLGEIFRIVGGGTPSTEKPNLWQGDLAWISSADISESGQITPRRTVSRLALEESTTNLMPSNSVIVVTRVGLGKVALATTPLCFSQDCHALLFNTDFLCPEFVAFQLRWRVAEFKHISRGTTIPGVTRKQLENTNFTLPPLLEQRRIVAEIEKQFTRLDAAAHKISECLKRLNKYLNSALPRLCCLPQSLVDDGESPLPSGWQWVRVSDVGEVKLGRQRSPEHHTGTHMRPYLRVANVFEDRIAMDSILQMNFTPDEYETYQLRSGDILLNEGQSLELVGRPAIYRDEVPGSCFQNTLVRFRVHSKLSPQYAILVFRAYLRTGRFQRIAKWTTNIAHLGATRFAEMYFPLPPLTIQEKIAEVSQRDLTLLANLKAEVRNTEKRAVRLRQAILAKAFSGQLVPQDPGDEPATVLLERLRRERSQTSAIKRTPRRSSTRHSQQNLAERL